MPQRKIILFTDSGEGLHQLSQFAVNNLFLPPDIGVALLHKEFINFDLQELFNSNQSLNIEYSYTEIFEKVLSNSALSKEQRSELLQLLSNNNIQPSLYFDDTEFLENLYEESLFADMIVCNNRTAQKLLQYKNKASETVGSYLHCPLLVSPNSSKEIENIFLVFDGKPQSMKAIKEFNYTLSRLYRNGDKNVTILSTMYNSAREQYEDKLLMQYAKLHIPNVGFMKINSNQLDDVLNFTRKNANSMLVLGNNFSSKEKTITNSLQRDWETYPMFLAEN